MDTENEQLRISMTIRKSPPGSKIQEYMDMNEARDKLLASDENEIVVMNDGVNMMTFSKVHD